MRSISMKTLQRRIALRESACEGSLAVSDCKGWFLADWKGSNTWSLDPPSRACSVKFPKLAPTQTSPPQVIKMDINNAKFEMIKDIGSGNFGVAKLMKDRLTGELVAVKFIERGDKIDKCDAISVRH